MCTKIGTIVKQQGGKIKAIKVTCRSWGCSTCAKDRKRRLISEAKEGVPQRFITLTVNPHWFNSPLERAEKLVGAWRLIRRRYLKLHPNAQCEFMAIFEEQKSGEPHLHICQRGAFISQKWLSRQLEELIGAKIVDIRFIRSVSKVAEYVTKYIGKKPHQFGTLKRYWRSKAYLPMTQAAKRRLRNAGARFFILDCHFKGLMRHMRENHPHVTLVVGRSMFEAEWPEDWLPPWCLLIEPIVCAE